MIIDNSKINSHSRISFRPSSNNRLAFGMTIHAPAADSFSSAEDLAIRFRELVSSAPLASRGLALGLCPAFQHLDKIMPSGPSVAELIVNSFSKREPSRADRRRAKDFYDWYDQLRSFVMDRNPQSLGPIADTARDLIANPIAQPLRVRMISGILSPFSSQLNRTIEQAINTRAQGSS